jgi:hypothetical protein
MKTGAVIPVDDGISNIDFGRGPIRAAPIRWDFMD